MTGLIVKRGNLDTETDTHRGGRHGEIGVTLPQAEEALGAGREAWTGSFLGAFTEIMALPTP